MTRDPAVDERSREAGGGAQEKALFSTCAGVLERFLARGVEYLVSLLVILEVVSLFVGIVARFVLHSPIVWMDEAASLLFLWLAMMGSVVALQRGEHMRMTALIARAPAELRTFLDVLAVGAALVFLVMLAVPSVSYAVGQNAFTSPALELSGSWRAAALPSGVVLMILLGIVRLTRSGSVKNALGALGAVAIIVGGFYLLHPVLAHLGNLNLLIFFLGVVVFSVLIGVPIAFAFGLATFGYLALTTRVPLTIVVGRMDEGMSDLVLLAIPLFVFLGLLMEMTGMARKMVDFLASLIGHRRGGLAYVLVGAMYLVSGISGSKAADMAAVVPALFPEMKKRGAKDGDLLALLAATSAQTETIPPSIVLITIGSVTGVSIAALFTGGLLPGLVVAIVLCGVVWTRYRHEDLSNVRKAGRREITTSLVVAIPALALPFLIRYAVVSGVATATEVSTIGIAYTFLVGLFVYRCFDWSRMIPMLVETASLSGAVLLIIGCANGMAWCLTRSGFSVGLANALTELPGGAVSFMAVSIVMFAILGSVLEGVPAIVLFGPLLFPIARDVGINEVHYAMVAILAMGMGLFTPPFGVGYYVASAIGRISPDAGLHSIGRYMLALLVGVIIIAAVPWISTGFIK
ncbi:MAG TPA: TRAP transporter large permease subunit [Castellaniella sp.]|uniref:TRAP transporter large permease n=1 Tax=Castellaniella sp. TaxID=1955812 RepID=UPI002EE06FD7